jgi:hypothetical protein
LDDVPEDARSTEKRVTCRAPVHEDIEQRASAHQTVDALGLDQTELTEEARILAAERVRARPRNGTVLPRALFTRDPGPGRTPRRRAASTWATSVSTAPRVR